MGKSYVLAVVVASLVSGASFAEAQTASPAPQAARHAMRGGMRGEHRGALKGIELSDAEKAKLKEVRQKYAPEQKKLAESMKPAMQEARALRQKGDTAGARAVIEKNKAGREQFAALRTREQAEVRAALSADNQKLFDQNVKDREARRAEWAAKGKGGHRGHHKS